MAEQLSEEQVQALQEKMKNMSPEELKEFQKKQCIFCQIIEGRVQSRKVYEDDNVMAVLDINPANPGHILLLPKEHYSIMPQMPESEISHIFIIAKALSNSLLKSVEAQGTNIIVANGVAAGQRAQHFMVHIIPRKVKDDIHFSLPQKTISENELEEVRKKLAKSLGKVEIEKSKAPPKFVLKKTEVEKPKVREKKKKATKNVQDEKKIKKPEAPNDVNLDDIAKTLGVK